MAGMGTGSFPDQRMAMIDALRERLHYLVPTLGPKAIGRALAAMAEVSRERFVCPWIEDMAYLPMPHDIGLGQTISHPEMVAVLAAAAAPTGAWSSMWGPVRAIEAAVLSKMADRVISSGDPGSTRRFHPAGLQRLGYGTVEVMTGDAAALGLFVRESFDAIVVAAGAPQVPSTLMAALKVGGRLVMPIGPLRGGATGSDGRLSTDDFRHTPLCPTRFVPLTGPFGRLPARSC
jgi:protein-L-isoaspartate(D-aspartate) O-methyltransferase